MYNEYAKLRDERGLTDSKVATETGVAKSTLSEWKAGKYTPKVDKLLRIAKYLGVSLETLIGVTE